MALINSKFAVIAAGAAALSLSATPAEARGWHHHDGISFGDVVVGGLILGGIAAVASAASNKSKHQDAYDYPPPPPPPSRYDGGYNYERAPAPRYRDGDDYAPPRERSYQSSGINGAVNSCVGEVEHSNGRVSAVDNATRTADGWHVSGQLAQGAGFDCSVDSDGRIRNVNVGNGRSAYNDAPQGGQWGDDDYASAHDQADAGNSYDGADDADATE